MPPTLTNLRIPGPTSLPDAVREAGARQMINHRGPEFAALLNRVSGRFKPFFGTENEILLLTCSGTGGLEAAIVNVLSAGDRVLAVSVGEFGDRFAAMATAYGAAVTTLDAERGHAADPADLRRALRSGPNPAAVLLTHNETSTGVTNPIRELATVVHEEAPQSLILVDAISGLGAVPFEMDRWGLDIVVTGSQKTWMVAPGMAMIALSERAWSANSNARMPHFYLDLAAARAFAAKGQTPATPAVAILFQLDIAMELLEREGLPGIFARHAACAAAARAGLEALGFRLFADPRFASNTVTAAWLPDGIDWKPFNTALLERGLVIAGGQGSLAGRIVRIGHLGDVTVDDVVAAVRVIETVLIESGRDLTAGAGVAAAERAAERASERGATGAVRTAEAAGPGSVSAEARSAAAAAAE
ncbi:MAG TPA: alanine--glyoxylate aminotransferase family protein [Vicinamibacterales bacterium]|nr:alanine--glyoxylate aminotransferase family protein [Vicinamibacterales bacterium]